MAGTARAIRLRPVDDVAVAVTAISAGDEVRAGSAAVTARQDIARGHKIALHELRAGQAVTRYGQTIGFAGTDIAAGEHVHEHNLEYREVRRDAEIAVDAVVEEVLAEADRASFDG